jgi:hypothetical protein
VIATLDPERKAAMIWVRIINKQRLSTAAGGTEKVYELAMQDWGLFVNKVQYAIEVHAVNGPNAQVGIRHDEAASPLSAAKRIHSNPIAVAAPADPPSTVSGATSDSTLLPYFWPMLRVSSGDANAQWVEVSVYVGGKRY